MLERKKHRSGAGQYTSFSELIKVTFSPSYINEFVDMRLSRHTCRRAKLCCSVSSWTHQRRISDDQLIRLLCSVAHLDDAAS